jgi:hypothetical protein
LDERIEVDHSPICLGHATVQDVGDQAARLPDGLTVQQVESARGAGSGVSVGAQSQRMPQHVGRVGYAHPEREHAARAVEIAVLYRSEIPNEEDPTFWGAFVALERGGGDLSRERLPVGAFQVDLVPLESVRNPIGYGLQLAGAGEVTHSPTERISAARPQKRLCDPVREQDMSIGIDDEQAVAQLTGATSVVLHLCAQRRARRLELQALKGS